MKKVLLAQHRVNAVSAISSIPKDVGAEIDLRTYGKDIILTHDSFTSGDRFEDWLKAYGKDRKGPLILNVKEDMLEEKAAELCQQYGLSNYFFIDVAFPTMRRLAESGFKGMSLRVSEYETLETARNFQGKVEWIWLDCFTGRVPEKGVIEEIHEMGFRIALVSPELHKYGEDVIRRHFVALEYLFENDVVCTKRPDLWASGSV